jgi:hypothetical protein
MEKTSQQHEPERCIWDFFYFTESNRIDPTAKPAVSISFEMDADLSAAEALQDAWAMGMPRGSNRTRCFEIQNSRGIFRCDDGKRLDRPTKPPVFKTWEELEGDE